MWCSQNLTSSPHAIGQIWEGQNWGEKHEECERKMCKIFVEIRTSNNPLLWPRSFLLTLLTVRQMGQQMITFITDKADL